ncbi:hypothetical protein [Sporosarcina sp. NPDC096371]|uniref:hypothetical protein n=1 Tax=Sporosarcina sp. NPDC096371 TaxID=3364530 RepID=UPI00382324B2
MTAIPKPKKVNRSVASPQLTECDYQEIGEKIEDASYHCMPTSILRRSTSIQLWGLNEQRKATNPRHGEVAFVY